MIHQLKILFSRLGQLGGVIRDITTFGYILSNLAKKRTYLAGDLGRYFLEKQIDRFNEEYIAGKGSGITLTNN